MSNTFPDNIVLAASPAGMVFAAEESNSEALLPKFTMTAYAGGPMDVGYWLPVVMDLEGMDEVVNPIPALLNHEPDDVAGHIVTATHDGKTLTAAGIVSGTSQEAMDMVSTAKNGFPWQASIGAKVKRFEELTTNATATVNGQEIQGPVLIARQWTLKEVSIVSIGADANTSTKISAKQNTSKKETPMATENIDPIAEAAAKHARIAEITAAASGDSEIIASALKEGWDIGRVQDRVALKAAQNRPAAPAAHTGNGGNGAEQAKVIEASMLIASGMSEAKVAKHFDAKTMESAVSAKNKGYGIGRLAYEVAANAGHSVTGGRLNDETIRAALRADGAVQASGSGWSNVTLTGILGNVANKSLLAGYGLVNDPWRNWCKVVSRSDFKSAAAYRLDMTGGYQKVASTGELKSAKLAETGFTGAQVDTYGMMLSLSRQMIINDDLGAFAQLPTQMGRRSAQGVRDAIYAALLGASGTFFATTGNKNKLTGSTSALSVTSLAAAEVLLGNQADANGSVIGLTGKTLLVGNANAVTARTIYASTNLKGSTDAPEANIFAGKYEPAVTALLTGTSAAYWYLIADAMECALMEVAFLNGNEAPVIESASTDFATLGVQWRMYHDFGCALQDPKAGVFAVGA